MLFLVSVHETRIAGTRRPHTVIHACLSQLTADGYPLPDPNVLGLEVPYRDEPLFWFDQYCRISPRLFNNYMKIHHRPAISTTICGLGPHR